MLISVQKARNLRVALFEESTQDDLEVALQEWLSSAEAEEADVLGVSFDADPMDDSYRANVLYTV